MNRLITYGSVDAIPYYNCSWRPIEEWWASGVKRPWLGILVFIIGAFIEFLYIPVIYIFFKTNLIKHTCYKLMTVLAMVDMSATVFSSLISGILLIQGAVYCTYPTFIYIAGGFALSTWCTSCAITVSLFFNRIISIAFKEYAVYVEAKMALISVIISFSYMFYINMFTPPIFFNSKIMVWAPDPLSEPVPSELAAAAYQNRTHDWNNWVYSVLMCILISIYYILVRKLANGQCSKTSGAIFIQCVTICIVNTATAVFYNFIAFITLSDAILVFCQLSWSVNHGVPAVIYVTMNSTVRREFKLLICGKRAAKVDMVHSSTANSNAITVTTG